MIPSQALIHFIVSDPERKTLAASLLWLRQLRQQESFAQVHTSLSSRDRISLTCLTQGSSSPWVLPHPPQGSEFLLEDNYLFLHAEIKVIDK